MNGQDLFFCEKHNARITMAACVKRQDKAITGDYMEINTLSFAKCLDCAKGKEIKKMMEKAQDPGLVTRDSSLVTQKTKPCPKCGEEKPLDSENWRMSRNTQDGWERTCKACRKEMQKKSYDKRMARMGKEVGVRQKAKVERRKPATVLVTRDSSLVTAPLAPPPVDFSTIGLEVGKLVEEKNKAYGDSFRKSGEVLRVLYPDGVRPDQYGDMLCTVRILDKLFRIATDKAALGENPYQDVAGYAILGVAAERR